jgi:Transposase IS116/IS110/IS902 family
VCPGNHESAGKHGSGRTRGGSKWLRVALVEAAHAAARTNASYLAAQYARLRGRRGPKKAAVAVAHSILVIAWHLLSRGEPYTDLGADYFLQRQSHQAYRDRLVRQLERMGHKVTPGTDRGLTTCNSTAAQPLRAFHLRMSRNPPGPLRTIPRGRGTEPYGPLRALRCAPGLRPTDPAALSTLT